MKPVVHNADFIGLLFRNLSNRVVISSRHHYYQIPRSLKSQRKKSHKQKNQSLKNSTRLTSEALVSVAVVEIEVFPTPRFVRPEVSYFVRWTDVIHYRIDMTG